jgi:hypothetical protein
MSPMMSNGTVFVLQVVPELLPLDDDFVDFRGRRQFVNVAKAFALQVADRAPQLLALLTDHVRTEVAIRSVAVAILANPVG